MDLWVLVDTEGCHRGSLYAATDACSCKAWRRLENVSCNVRSPAGAQATFHHKRLRFAARLFQPITWLVCSALVARVFVNVVGKIC